MEHEYDDCGNTTKQTIYKDEGTEEIIFEYDTMNRLVKTTEDTVETTYSYDNAGNRFIKQSPEGTTVYLRHGQIAVAMDIELPVSTTEEQGRINRYVLSGDLLAGRITLITNTDFTTDTETSYYHLDHLNSTKCVTDDSGVLVVMYEYRAFGEQLKRLDSNGEETGDVTKYSYSGKELDNGTNLYYFNARYYDATIGRFINVDPVQDGGNWYVYCGNNPLCFVDPTGLEDDKIVFDEKILKKGMRLYIAEQRKKGLSMDLSDYFGLGSIATATPGVIGGIGIIARVVMTGATFAESMTPVGAVVTIASLTLSAASLTTSLILKMNKKELHDAGFSKAEIEFLFDQENRKNLEDIRDEIDDILDEIKNNEEDFDDEDIQKLKDALTDVDEKLKEFKIRAPDKDDSERFNLKRKSHATTDRAGGLRKPP